MDIDSVVENAVTSGIQTAKAAAQGAEVARKMGFDSNTVAGAALIAAAKERVALEKGKPVSKAQEAVFGAASDAAWQTDLFVNREPFVGAYSNDGAGHEFVAYGKPDGGRFKGVRFLKNGKSELVRVGKDFLAKLESFKITDKGKVRQLVKSADAAVRDFAKKGITAATVKLDLEAGKGLAFNAGKVVGMTAGNVSNFVANAKSAVVSAVNAPGRAVAAAARSFNSGSVLGSRSVVQSAMSRDGVAPREKIHAHGVALYEVDGNVLMVTNHRCPGNKGYYAYWLNKEPVYGGRLHPVEMKDNVLAKIHGSWSMKSPEERKADADRLFRVVNEHNRGGLAQAVYGDRNNAFKPNYQFVDQMMGRGKNPLIQQMSDLVAGANKLPVFAGNMNPNLKPSQSYFEYPACCMDGNGRLFGGMSFLSASAQLRDVPRNGNAYVLVNPEKNEAKVAPVNVKFSSLEGGRLNGPLSRVNSYRVAPLIGVAASRKVSDIMAYRLSEMEKGQRDPGYKKTHSFYLLDSNMSVVDFLATYQAAANLGLAIETSNEVRMAMRDQFVKMGQDMGRGGRYGEFLKTFDENVRSRAGELALQKSRELDLGAGRTPEKKLERNISLAAFGMGR